MHAARTAACDTRTTSSLRTWSEDGSERWSRPGLSGRPEVKYVQCWEEGEGESLQLWRRSGRVAEHERGSWDALVLVSSMQLPPGSWQQARLSSNSTSFSRPPGLWDILYWIIVFMFYVGVARAAGSRAYSLTLTRGATPFLARGPATASDRISMQSRIGLYPRESRSGEGGRVAFENQPTAASRRCPSGLHLGRGHHTTAPLVPLVGGIHD